MTSGQLSGHFERFFTREWREADFPSLEILERWLTAHGLDSPHDEGEPDAEQVYQHTGYKAIPCRVCHQPTIVGAYSADASCGRPACDLGLLAAQPNAEETSA